MHVLLYVCKSECIYVDKTELYSFKKANLMKYILGDPFIKIKEKKKRVFWTDIQSFILKPQQSVKSYRRV